MKYLIKIIPILLSLTLLAGCNSSVNSSQIPQQSSDSSTQSSQISEKQTNSTPQSSTATQSSETTPQGTPIQDTSTENFMYKGNPDEVAWLKIPSTDIDSPVMQTKNNEDYLQRNENGEQDVWGCLFADYYSNLTSPKNLTQNTVIYGHSANTENPDSKRFSQLFRYLDIDFLKENTNIYLNLGDKELIFQIFAVFYTDTDFYYIDPIPSQQDFSEFIEEVNRKNEFVFANQNITEKDKLLTLSACAYRYDIEGAGDHRFVVMAKLVENPQPPIVTANPNPIRP